MIEPARILVVDPNDDEANRCIQALDARGWQVDRARSFAEAAKLVQESSYRVVIMEVNLPDLLGTEGWRRLKIQRPDMACILTTSSASLREGVAAYDLEVLDFMLKPLRMDAVGNLILQSTRHQHVAAAKLQREHELSGIALWLSNLLRMTTRRQIFDATIAHLEVILPAIWTAVFFTTDGQLGWICRSTSYLPDGNSWSQEELTYVGDAARDAIQTGQVVTRLPSMDSGINCFREAPKSIIIVPLQVQSRTHGALALLKEQSDPEELPQAEIDLAMLLAKILALALDRIQFMREPRSLPLSVSNAAGPVEG